MYGTGANKIRGSKKLVDSGKGANDKEDEICQLECQMRYPVRIMQSLSAMNHGGIEHFVMNVYRKIDRNKIQFDFLYRVSDECVFDDEITGLGGRIFRVPSPDKRPLRARAMYREIFSTGYRYAVLHEHRSECSGLLESLRIARKMGISTRIVHAHNSASSSGNKTVMGAARNLSMLLNRRRLGLLATDYFACSNLAAIWLFGDASKTCRIIPNGIDSDHFAFNQSQRDIVRGRYGIPTEARVIGNVSRFSPAKNHAFLIDLLKYLNEKNGPRYWLLLVGDGELKRSIENLAHQKGVKQRVIFVGETDDPAPYYSAMDVFCMPSIYEGLPLSAIEAQASGLRVVFSDSISKASSIRATNCFLQLNSPLVDWASRIEEGVSGTLDRSKAVEDVKTAGFDVSEVANMLESFYLERASR